MHLNLFVYEKPINWLCGQMIMSHMVLIKKLYFLKTLFFYTFYRQRHGNENMPHCESFISINSIQRLVLLRLQDRPPPYSSSVHNSKNKMHQNGQVWDIITVLAVNYSISTNIWLFHNLMVDWVHYFIL